MKRIILFSILVFSNLFSNVNNNRTIKVLGMEDSVILIKEKTKYSIWDVEGNRITNDSFTEALLFSEGLAAVKKNGKWGYINKTGKVVIEFSYDYAGAFNEGLAIVKTNNRIGYIDKNGKIIILSKYDDVNNFNNGIALVMKNGKWGFVDKNGKEKATPKYDYIDTFHEGIAIILKDFKYGFINLNGEEIIQPKYDFLGNFSNGIAKVEKNNKVGYVNKNGKLIIDIKYDRGSSFSKNGFAIVEEDNKLYIIDRDEKIFKKLKSYNRAFEILGAVNNSVVNSDEGIFIDSNGNKYLEFLSYIITNQNYIIAKEKNNENKPSYVRYDAVFDNNGNQLTPFKYLFYDNAMLSSVDDYSFNEPYFINGYSVIQTGIYQDDYEENYGYKYLFGLIDATGKEIIPPEYSWIYNSTGDTGLVVDKTSSKLGVYNIEDNKLSIKWIFNGIVDI